MSLHVSTVELTVFYFSPLRPVGQAIFAFTGKSEGV